MRAVLQRVSEAKVSVENEIIGEISNGLLIFLGVSREDSEIEAKSLLNKIVNLRIFSDADGKMNLSVLDVNGELLIVSQFTLYGDARKGTRPSYIRAGDPESANRLYEYFISEAKTRIGKVATGKFQAMMDVQLTNDGPVTILLDTEKTF
ncbi:MAG: D-aminoacyl-tRNA deacylase [Pyrinomonadaceae bacterium]